MKIFNPTTEFKEALIEIEAYQANHEFGPGYTREEALNPDTGKNNKVPIEALTILSQSQKNDYE